MKTLRFRPDNPIRYPHDVGRLWEALRSLGYTASPGDIVSAYEEYSEQEYCAGWLALPPSDDGLQLVAQRLVDNGYLVEDERTEESRTNTPTNETTPERGAERP